MKALLLVLVAISLASSLDAACPHLTAGLQSWKNASSWASGVVPAAGASVVIPAGKKILLDVSPPELTSITIESGGQLVWSPTGDFEVRAKYILVKGRLDIGSEDCKFTRKAIITLVGNYGASPVVTGFGSKFLGVAAGGSLELHGLDPSPSWTKLTATVQSSVTLGGSSNLTTLGRGFNVAMYNAQGTLLGYKSFDFLGNVTFQTAFQTFLNSQPAGTVMAAAVADALCSPTQIQNATYDALAAYGAKLFRSTGYRYSYAIIGVKGGSAIENYTATGAPTAFLARTFTYNNGSSSFIVRAQSKGWVDKESSFAKIEREFAGTVIINLLDNVTWKAGDKIVLAATDFSPYQSEEATLASCPECAKNQVKLTALPQYQHHGAIVDGVDERGEVGLLTRNILIRGAVQSSCYGMAECAYIPDNVDIFGGQLKVVKGFANVHIESVEFYKMGQQILGSYPVHFHLCGDVDGKGNYTQPAYVKKSSIHRSLHRCVSIHGTNGLLFQDNVAYDHYGHCVFFEDGIETRNVVDRNLAMLTRFGTVIPTDRSCSTCTAMAPPGFGVPDCGECLALSTYWITNPDNIVTNNVAAGSEFVGFWYIFPERPTGLSEQLGLALKIKPAWTKMGLMENNTAHSNKGNGLHIDDGIKAGNQTLESPIQQLAKIGARYNPRVNFTDRASARAPAIISRYLAYKNKGKGSWARGGDIWYQDCTFADGPIGLTLASEGAMPNDPASHQAVVRSLFVGLTANKGQRVPDLTWDPVLNRTHFGDLRFPIRGFEIYDGPLRIENNRFKNFLPDSRHNGSAYGNLLSDNWQLAPTSYAKASTFLDASRRIYHGLPSFYTEHDGDRNPVILDLDGTISGIANSFIVADNPFFKSKNCTSKPDWDAAVCWAQKYGQLFIQNYDSARTNYSGITTGQVFYMTRDEYSAYPLGLEGIPSATPRVQFQPLVMLSKGYTIKFAYPTPPKLSFQLTNWNAGNWARISVCYPPANFTVTKSIGSATTTLTPVNTIAEVNNSSSGSVYFYDSARGLLFFKAVALNNRNGYEYCGSGGCETYRISAQGPQVGKNYACTPYPTYAVTPV